MAKYENICKYIHLPVQSGSTQYIAIDEQNLYAEWYMAKVDRISEIIPDCGISAQISLPAFVQKRKKIIRIL